MLPCPSPVQGEGGARSRSEWEGEGTRRCARSTGRKHWPRVRELRRTATPAEEKLWAEVRDRRLGGFKFRFQAWVGPFIADFLCKQARLIVEVDGSQHADQVAEDAARSAWLDRNGYRVLRVWNNEVLQDIEPVLAASDRSF